MKIARTQRGATLLEVLVVVAIMIILAGMLLPVASKAVSFCKEWAEGSYNFHNERIWSVDHDNVFKHMVTNDIKTWMRP